MKEYYGCYPTMITPFTQDGKVDFKAVGNLVDWYIKHGSNGIFAVCQSSEMFFLSSQEKLDIVKAVLDANAGRVKVIASGHTADDIHQQIDELGHMSETGVDAVVLVSNRLARKDEGEDVFRQNADKIFDSLPGVTFGMYECPYPYLRLLSDDFFKYVSDANKVVFLKDVSGADAIQRRRVNIAKASELSLFNAHTSSILSSFRLGYDGYNGIMANFHMELYRWLYDNYKDNPELADKLQDFLSVSCMVEARCYPVSAKWYQNEYGVKMDIYTRSRDVSLLNESGINELRALYRMTEDWKKRLGVES